MTNNDLFYVCSLIEFIGRQTCNHRKTVVDLLGVEGIKKQLHDAPVNHCLTFEQVADEIIEYYKIPASDFDTVSNCKYKVPGFQDIGKLYAIIIESCAKSDDFAEELKKLFSSIISDEISRFNTDFYYQNPDYIKCCYLENEIL